MGMDRKNIDDKYKWNIDLMYSNKESIEKDIEKVKSYINNIKQYKGKLSQSKENMYEALNVYEKASQLLQNLYVYTHMKQHEDTRINENQAMATKTDMLSTELSTASSYMIPEIISIDESKLKAYLEDEKLSFYKKYIDEILRDKPHTLSEKEEEILAAVSDLTSVPENSYDMLSYADMEFPEIENEDGEITVESVEDYFQTMYGEFGTPDKVHVETYTENSSRTEIECIDIKVEYKDYFRQLENVEEDLVLDLDLDSTVNYEDYVLIASYQSSPLTAQTTILNTLLSVGIAIVVMAIYLMIRFRYTYSITLILAMISNLLITFALFAIFRIEMTVSFVLAALTIVLFTANYSIVLFDRIRELCKETNHGKINQNDRFEIVNRSLASTFNRTAIVTLSMFMPLLVLVIIGTSATFNFSIALILGLVASVVTNTFIAPRLWLFLERKHVIRIKEKSVKRGKERKQSNELEELTIPGIND